MPDQPPSTPTSLIDRFAAGILKLCEAVCDEGVIRRIAFPLLWLIDHRMETLLERLLTRIERGPTPAAAKPRPTAPQTPKPDRAPAKSPKPPKNWPGYAFGPPPRLPTCFGWLRHVVPGPMVDLYIAKLNRLMTDPELAALIEADPAIVRILRPLCHMLGITPPPDPTKPPPRPRRTPIRPTAPNLPNIYDPRWVGTFTYIPGVKKFTC